MNIRGARTTGPAANATAKGTAGQPAKPAAQRTASQPAKPAAQPPGKPRRPLADEVLEELTSWQSRLRMAAFQAWARGTLSIVHLSVLAALEAHGPLSMTKLAETLDVSVASATGIVTRMENRGVVRRRHAEADRRVVLVEVTSAGAKVARVMEKHRNERLRTLLDGLTDDELASFLLGLRALAAARSRLHFEKTKSGIVAVRTRERGR